MRRLRTIVLSAALTALLAMTYSGPPDGAAASSVQLPAGVYTTTLFEADVPPEFPPAAIPIFVGEWTLEFNEDGSYSVAKAGAAVAGVRSQ